MSNCRIIAFYLPQYHPIELNNKYYGEGFTEWTNVKKATPLYKDHYQPKVPADLGYYDLRDAETREKQAEMAKEAGIEGFCYYHYWFGKGHEELEYPFEQVVKMKKPDFPFCLCWANQSWYAKFWSKDKTKTTMPIAEQIYDDEEWNKKHFESLLEAFKDERHIRVDGKVLFMIYRPLEYPGVEEFMKQWQKLAKENGFEFYFVGQSVNDEDAQKVLALGFDGVNVVRKDDFLKEKEYNNAFSNFKNKVMRALGCAPYHYEYKNVYKYFIHKDGLEKQNNIFPTLLPNWDHSARSGKKAVIFDNPAPEYFKEHLVETIKTVEHKRDEEKIIFLKSWNEWGEGNYVEPDARYGRGYLDVLKECVANKK